MNRLLSLATFLLLALCAPAWSAVALVATSAFAFGGGNQVSTSPVDTTGASLLVLVSGRYSGEATCPVMDSTMTLSDTVGGSATGNIWHCAVISSQEYGAAVSAIYYSYNSAGGALVVGANHVVQEYFPSYHSMAFALSAWSGTNTSSDPLDQTNSNYDDNTVISSGNITPTASGDLLIGTSIFASSAAWTATPTFTEITQTASSSAAWQEDMSYLVQGTAAQIGASWTWGASTSVTAAVASFFAAAAPPPAGRRRIIVVN